jgi:hypothetical protein
LRYGLIFGKGLGIIGGAGLANLNVINLGGELNEFTDRRLSVMLDYLIFSNVEKAAANVATDLGNELDLQLKYPVHKNVKLGVSYAMYSPGKEIKDAFGVSDTVTRWGADLSVKF